MKGFYHKGLGSGCQYDDIYIVDSLRSPFGKFCGSLKNMGPTELLLSVSSDLLKKTKTKPEDIDQTICSSVALAANDFLYLSRHLGLYLGLPTSHTSLTVQRLCGSGLEVIAQCASEVSLGKSQLSLGASVEVMSRIPLVSYNARFGFPLGGPEYFDLLWEALKDSAACSMGETADRLAKSYGLSREQVDEFALCSQERYQKAKEEGFFKGEITPIPTKGLFKAPDEKLPLKDKKYNLKLKGVDALELDEHPRLSSFDKMKKLPFVFTKEGPTTAANASGIVDGAVSALISNKKYINEKNITPLGQVLGWAVSGVDPYTMGIGPVPAINLLLKEFNLSIDDIDLFEINEAFGAQVLSVASELQIDLNKLNIHGGAIALGHPLAATGGRLALTLMRSLAQRGGGIGIASACIGGGQGAALLLKV